MSKKDKSLITLALIGAGVYLLTRKQAATPPAYYNYPQIPPAPPANTPQWQQWVALITQTFGTVANLWAPGGPFYKEPVTPGQAIEITNDQQYYDYA